ncbi:MAG: hypothetical protein HC927_01950 [Deltaproteobacteria bacterium]|nr:hypothetical protein [Deltaproteobacteria bacterium]
MYTFAMNLLGRSPRVTLLAISLLGLAACKNKGISVDEYVDSLSTGICEAVIDCNCEYPDGALYDHCVAQLSVVFRARPSSTPSTG